MFSFNKVVQRLLNSVINMVPTFYIFGGLAMQEERKGIVGALEEQEKGYAESTEALEAERAIAEEDVAATEQAGLATYQPWQEAGAEARTGFQTLLSEGLSREQLEQDPAYQWRLSQGLQARERSASRYGQRFSGGLLAELEKYAQGEASSEYEKIYGRKAQGYGGLMSLGMRADEGAAQWRGSMFGARRSIADYYGSRMQENILGRAGARAGAEYGKYQASAKLFAGIHKDMAKMSMAFATKGGTGGQGGETGLGQGGYNTNTGGGGGSYDQQGNYIGGMSSYNWGGQSSSNAGFSGSQFSSYNG